MKKPPLQIGLISDTHRLLRPEATELLKGADLIVHAGDIGSQPIIEQLSELAPVVAVRGNIDKEDWAAVYAEEEVIDIAGRSIYVLHNRHDLDIDPKAAGFDVVVSGHSHKPSIETLDDVLYVNPGSAGPRRFKLPVTLGFLTIGVDHLGARIETIPIL